MKIKNKLFLFVNCVGLCLKSNCRKNLFKTNTITKKKHTSFTEKY